MIPKQSIALILSAMMLTACGGGGGSAPSLVKAPDPTVITPPNSSATWSSIVQGADYTFDPAAIPVLKVLTTTIRPVDTQTGSTKVTTGAPIPGDLNLGQPTSITNTLAGITYVSGPNPATTVFAWLSMPYSPTLDPAGFSYQLYGAWTVVDNTTGATSEYYLSTGIPTIATTLPVRGTATYNGRAEGTFVDAATGDWSDTYATMNATASFAAQSVAFSTANTITLSRNAAAGTPPTLNTNLDMTGTLTYATGGNTFTGAVTTPNGGMTGTATGRFYGPGIATATATKVAGAPPEIGGTFAVTGATGAMLGAFGGK